MIFSIFHISSALQLQLLCTCLTVRDYCNVLHMQYTVVAVKIGTVMENTEATSFSFFLPFFFFHAMHWPQVAAPSLVP